MIFIFNPLSCNNQECEIIDSWILFAVIFEIYSGDGSQVLQDDVESIILCTEGGKLPQSVLQVFATVC